MQKSVHLTYAKGLYTVIHSIEHINIHSRIQSFYSFRNTSKRLDHAYVKAGHGRQYTIIFGHKNKGSLGKIGCYYGIMPG